MNTLRYKLAGYGLTVLLLGGCSSSGEIPEEGQFGEVKFSLSTNDLPATKVNDAGDGFTKDDPIIICNTQEGPDESLKSDGRYAIYTHTEEAYSSDNKNSNCTVQSGSTAIIWDNIKRYGTQYYFTATSSPVRNDVEADQSKLDKLKASDFLIARTTLPVSKRGEHIHLVFKHVLCKVDIEVYVPISDMDFKENALTAASLIKRQTAFDVTYSASTGDGQVMPVAGSGDTDKSITPYEVSKETKNITGMNNIANGKYQIYKFQAILPKQEAQLGEAFARFTIAGDSYTYRPTGGMRSH
ncbi:MAG: fimbrillin family protein [Parabacteroides gordonii]|nr:fimbrillin family protein [Parabacteroides gordonii]